MSIWHRNCVKRPSDDVQPTGFEVATQTAPRPGRIAALRDRSAPLVHLAVLIVAFSAPELLQAQSGAKSEQSPAAPPRVCLCNGWFVAETSGFWVCCFDRGLPIAGIAQQCETLHQQLREKWLAEKPPADWSPKCMVVFHPTRESYLAAVGQDAANTSGSSLVEYSGKQISMRRIDLRGDRPDYLSAALPHELTHVILADHFSQRSLPRWADEGMAILADPPAKRDQYARELRTAMANRTAFGVPDLLKTKGYPPPERWGGFYSESVSVVDYLVKRGSAHRFVQFLG